MDGTSHEHLQHDNAPGIRVELLSLLGFRVGNNFSNDHGLQIPTSAGAGARRLTLLDMPGTVLRRISTFLSTKSSVHLISVSLCKQIRAIHRSSITKATLTTYISSTTRWEEIPGYNSDGYSDDYGASDSDGEEFDEELADEKC